jgi:hypothetical protein
MDRLSEQVRAAVVAAQDDALAIHDRVELRGVTIAGVPAMTSRVVRPCGRAMATSRCNGVRDLDLLP